MISRNTLAPGCGRWRVWGFRAMEQKTGLRGGPEHVDVIVDVWVEVRTQESQASTVRRARVLKAAQELDHRRVDLIRSFLLCPVTAARKGLRSAQAWHEAR
jgi:hypothetical protein